MKQLILAGLLALSVLYTTAQAPKTYTSSELLQQLKKMNVLGSVLYVAAHPDDENTRLLAYLANEKLYRTGYLSLTRGDGGQNLIGDEQGIDLGLIRTQELLAARRIDGAEQFFSRAYDFGFSKSPEEAMRIWGHDEILSDVVWVIRKFRPDVIICRFPTTGEGGHGHHTASAILAEEAFDAAADPNRFPEQFQHGVTTWKATRLLWNTFNFGSANTQRPDQFKVDVGQFNPLLGKSYGELAALSRSQHKSQGFGVPAQRGSVLEYFKTIKGTPPVNDLMDGVDVSWNRVNGFVKAAPVSKTIDSMITAFNSQRPDVMALPMANLIKSLVDQEAIYQGAMTSQDKNANYTYVGQKIAAAKEWIANCMGVFVETVALNQLNVKGDTMKLITTVNVRNSELVKQISATAFGVTTIFDSLSNNATFSKNMLAYINDKAEVTQPYWLAGGGLQGGRFAVSKQEMIGLPEYNALQASFSFTVGNMPITLNRPVQYKYTDPVKGELYEPVEIVNPVFVNARPSLVLFNTNNKKQQKKIALEVQFNRKIQDTLQLKLHEGSGVLTKVKDTVMTVAKGDKKRFEATLNSPKNAQINATALVRPLLDAASLPRAQYMTVRKISYDHIPDIYYEYGDMVKTVNLDLKVAGSHVGYITGAGDKVPEALEQMGYKVTLLKETDINAANLKQFDAIVTGVRAYNTNDWMNNVYDVLMQYVKEGGTMLVQYNTSNQIGPVKAKISPYPFTISRNRITDETATVNFLQPAHDVLNYPNKITAADFEGWIQERSIYHAAQLDSNYQAILSMADPNEKPDNGSLIVSNYGNGRFIYTGLVFFRELPAGVPGAYRLFANLIAPVRKYHK